MTFCGILLEPKESDKYIQFKSNRHIKVMISVQMFEEAFFKNIFKFEKKLTVFKNIFYIENILG